MKSLFATILIVSFISIAVFGIFGMYTEMQNHGGGCIAASIKGENCPKQSNLLEYLAFHINAFRDFSAVTFGVNFLTLLLVLNLLIVGIGLKTLVTNSSHLSLAYAYCQRWEFFSFLSKQKLIRWLALHENSPTII